MRIVDVVKYQGNDSELVWKFPLSDLTTGTQVIVSTAQVAIFVKGGKIYDIFESGTHTITPLNIPLLGGLIKFPFSGETPFQAEVWFVNLITKPELLWGTPAPIQVEDPKYKIIVPVRAFGQYAIKIADPKLFLETIVGNLTSYSVNSLNDFFKGQLFGSLTNLISSEITKNNISVLEINSNLNVIANSAFESFKDIFNRYGVELVNFIIKSINIPEEDTSLKKLKEAKELAAKINIVGRENYQMDRSFDVLDTAAEGFANNDGIGGSIANAGFGLGIGSAVLGHFSNIVSTSLNPLNNSGKQNAQRTMPDPDQYDEDIPPIPEPETKYFVVINNAQQGPFGMEQMKSLLMSGKINRQTYVWTAGMDEWDFIENQYDFDDLLALIPPPLPPMV